MKRAIVVFGFLHTADIIFRRTPAFSSIPGNFPLRACGSRCPIFSKISESWFCKCVMYLVFLTYLVRVRRARVLRQSWLYCPKAPQTGWLRFNSHLCSFVPISNPHLHIQGDFFNCPPCSVPKRYMAKESTWGCSKRMISWNSNPGWLLGIFLIPVLNRGEQVKKITL